jgi:hypothetical protein
MSNSVEGPVALGNRRAHRRAALSAPVLIDSARSHHTGRCRDVSEGGLLVELETELPIGMPVDLYFELPTGIAIEAQGAVVTRSGKSVLGLRFDSLKAEDRLAVSAYCATWRAALLSKCARRVATIPSQQLTASALGTAAEPSSVSGFDASEPNSGVRIRIAHDFQAANEEKPKIG